MQLCPICMIVTILYRVFSSYLISIRLSKKPSLKIDFDTHTKIHRHSFIKIIFEFRIFKAKSCTMNFGRFKEKIENVMLSFFVICFFFVFMKCTFANHSILQPRKNERRTQITHRLPCG